VQLGMKRRMQQSSSVVRRLNEEGLAEFAE
jgi:hypothetical protein